MNDYENIPENEEAGSQEEINGQSESYQAYEPWKRPNVFQSCLTAAGITVAIIGFAVFGCFWMLGIRPF